MFRFILVQAFIIAGMTLFDPIANGQGVFAPTNANGQFVVASAPVRRTTSIKAIKNPPARLATADATGLPSLPVTAASTNGRLSAAVVQPTNVLGANKRPLIPYPNISTTTPNAQGLVNSVNAIPGYQMLPLTTPAPSMPQIPAFPMGGPNGSPMNGSSLPGNSFGNMGSKNPYSPIPSTSYNPAQRYSSIAPTAPAHHAMDNFYPGYGGSDKAPSDLAGYNCNNRNQKDALTCMVCNVVYEACDEPDSAKEMLARSVMTRVMSNAYPDTVCKTVYQNNGRVAQYSWIFEHKNHTLHAGGCIFVSVAAAKKALKEGPNGYTNYYAYNLVHPNWANSGSCRPKIGPSGTVNDSNYLKRSGHIFQCIGATEDRTYNQWLAAENIHNVNTYTQVASSSGAVQ